MTRELGVFSFRSAAAAYRKDAAGRGGEDAFGALDGVWIAVVTLLEHAARVDGANQALLDEAAQLALESLQAERRLKHDGARNDVERDAVSHYSRFEVIRTFAEWVEESGAVNIAFSILTAYLSAAPDLSLLEVGRITAHQARILSKLGDLDGARAGFQRVSRLGSRAASSELKARAFMGFGALAQLEGDYAALRRWSVAAARLAPRHKNPELTRFAHNGLFVSAAATARYDEALIHGWKAYELAAGDRLATAEVLGNLGQLLLLAGHPETSQAAYGALLSTPLPPRIGLPSLGGFALASAAIRSDEDVRWAAREIDREAKRAIQPFLIADASLEVAAALATIGEHRAAAMHRGTALSIATAHGLHRIVAGSERTTGMPSDAPESSRILTPKAARVARAVERLRPHELPIHVTFVDAA